MCIRDSTGTAKWIDYVLSGDVTSTDAGVVTIADTAVQTDMVHTDVITGQTVITSGVDLTNDFLLLYDDSASAYKKVSPGNMGITGLPAGSANEVQYRVSASAAGGATNVEIKNNSLALKEQSAPTNVSGYGMLYAAANNELYFKDDGGNATQITNAGALAGGGAFKGTKLYLTNGTTSVADDSAVTMTAWDESFDVGAMHAGTNGRITFGQVGYWNISIQQEWAADSSGYREMRVTHTDTSNSNTTNVILRDRAIPSLQDTTVSGSSTVFYVDDVADYLTVQLYQNSGSALDAIGSNDDSTVVTVTRLDMATQGSGTASGSAGHVQFSDGSGGFSHDANAIFWDATNNRLGVNTGSPGYSIDATAAGTVRAQTYTGTIGTATQNSITTMTGLVSTGALASGSIASGFGTISTGNSITTTAAITGGSLVVDNFTLDGTELDLSVGDFTVDVAGDITLNADGGDINFMDDSASLGTISSTGYSGNSATATTSTNVFAAADSTNADQYVAFLDNADTNAQQVLYDTGITYNPSSNALTTAGPIQGSSVTSTGGLTLSGDITATGAAIDIDLIDNNASAISFDAAGLAGILAIVTTNGGEKVTMSGGLEIAGDLIVSGTTTTVNSTTTTVDDPVFTIGGDTAPSSDDNKDRGIEFRYHTGSAAAIGFFGFDDSTGKFTALTAASNSSEVFSGTAMPAIFGNIEGAAVTGTSFTIGSASIAEAELEMIDGITAGTAAASKALVLDSNKDISGIRNITLDQDANIAWTSGLTINDDSSNNAAYINLASGDALYLQDGGTTNMSIAASGAITMQAGNLTLGAGAEADYGLYFNGHSGGQNWYIASDDGYDDLIIGLGNTTPTTPIMSFTNALGDTASNNGSVNIGALGALSGIDTFVKVRRDVAHTLTAGDYYYDFLIAPNAAITTPSTGTANPLIATMVLSEPVITNGGVQPTVGATLKINNAPTEAASNYALWVADGVSRFEGEIQSTSNTQAASIATAYANYGLVFRAPQATNEYSNSIGWSEGTNVAAAISAQDDGAGGALGLSFATGTNSALTERVKIHSSGVFEANAGAVFNEGSVDVDFRIESNGNANMFVVDGGTDAVGIGAAPNINDLLTLGGTHTGYSNTFGLRIEPTLNAVAGNNAAVISVAGTLVEAGSGTHNLLFGTSFSAPTVTGGSAAVANTATVYISGAPSATVTGANYALWVDAGLSRFDGIAQIGPNSSAYSTFQLEVANAGNGDQIRAISTNNHASVNIAAGTNGHYAFTRYTTLAGSPNGWETGVSPANEYYINPHIASGTTGSSIIITAATDLVTFKNQIKIEGGSPGADKILTSAADGTASWEESTAASTGLAVAMAIVF